MFKNIKELDARSNVNDDEELLVQSGYKVVDSERFDIHIL